MRKGKNWPIPYKQLVNGSVLATKNASRLTRDAKIAYSNNCYASAFALSVFAIEEWGKCFLLIDVRKAKKLLTEDDWHKEIESHPKKIDALIRYLYKSINQSSVERAKQTRKFQKQFRDWLKLRQDALYLDWDASAGKWLLCDDNSNEAKDLAQKAVSEAERILNIYLEMVGDLPFATIEDKLRMIQKREAYAFCKSCGLVMIEGAEITLHHKRYPGHSGYISWYKI